jgi:hypothetical protein
MQFVLMSNILEHPGFFDCVQAWVRQNPDTGFLLCGDLLNVFPEPGEDLLGSIFAEVYGDWIEPAMQQLIDTRFKQLDQSPFIDPLQQMFTPNGSNYTQASTIARQRYQRFFARLADALQEAPFYYIPGNMDYPKWGLLATQPYDAIHQIDADILTMGHAKVGALGGIPNHSHPFKGLAEISPYEMAPQEYERRLWQLAGVDVLITHLSPEEYPPLLDFVRQTPLKVLICRAPFNFTRQSDFRGQLEVSREADKPIYKIRPFDYPHNRAMVIDLDGDLSKPVRFLEWQAEQTA